MAWRRRRSEHYRGPERRAPAMVMVVNDDPDAAELVCRILVAAGYRVCRAADHDEALRVAAEQLPRAAVLGVSKGGIASNLYLLEALRHRNDQRVATTRVALITRDASSRTFSFQSGTDAFLSRPFHAEQLLEAVHTILAVPADELPQHRRRQLEGSAPAP